MSIAKKGQEIEVEYDLGHCGGWFLSPFPQVDKISPDNDFWQR